MSARYQAEPTDGTHGTSLPSGLLVPAQDSLGTALVLARQLPAEAGRSVAIAARDAFVTGMGPTMTAGIGVAGRGIVIALVFSPRARRSQPAGTPLVPTRHTEEPS
jgi:hypothetical protein